MLKSIHFPSLSSVGSPQRSFLLSHSLGLVLYLLAQPLGFVSAEGIGGSFGWLFYGFALICSLVLESVIAVVRRLLQKP